MTRLARLLAARFLRRAALAGRPWQVRVAWWAGRRAFRRAWARLSPQERDELRRLAGKASRGPRGLTPADRAERARLLRVLRGRAERQ